MLIMSMITFLNTDHWFSRSLSFSSDIIPLHEFQFCSPTHWQCTETCAIRRNSIVQVNRATKCWLESRRWTVEYSVRARLEERRRAWMEDLGYGTDITFVSYQRSQA